VARTARETWLKGQMEHFLQSWKSTEAGKQNSMPENKNQQRGEGTFLSTRNIFLQ
jgi:hypothetical protein